jgi:Homeodomain-like domain
VGRRRCERANWQQEETRAEALQRLAAGETQTDIARSYNVSHVTIGRLQPRPFPADGAGAPA